MKRIALAGWLAGIAVFDSAGDRFAGGRVMAGVLRSK